MAKVEIKKVFDTNYVRGIEEPDFVKKLFNDVRFSVVWLVLRVWLGWQWFEAGLHKFEDPAWIQSGEALKGFFARAVAIPENGRPAISFDWYRSFLQLMLDTEAYTWFSKVVVYGELLVGIALIVGAFVGVAAFCGAFMNWNFMMAGTASTNPMLFVVALLLIFAWKTAGYLGADYFLLKWLGTPWKREEFKRAKMMHNQHGYAGAGD
jgi:thiosulfate dehydrogenase [quinone] large subunit